MGLFDRIKSAFSVELPDPNTPVYGTPARGHIVDGGPYSVGGEGSATVRWSKKQLTLYVVGGSSDQLATVSCFLNEQSHRWAGEGREIPIVLDSSGAVLGVDVPAWEAEVAAAIERGESSTTAAPVLQADARHWDQQQGALDQIEGVDFDTYVAVEAALAREAVAPAQWDARATELGVPAGCWAAAQSGWQTRMRSDWKLAARFGAAYAAATGQ